MTSNDVTEMRYWIDLALKGLIGVVVSIVGLDYRAMKKSLSDLEQAKYVTAAEVQIVQSELRTIKDRLEKIDGKLDRALQR